MTVFQAHSAIIEDLLFNGIHLRQPFPLAYGAAKGVNSLKPT